MLLAGAAGWIGLVLGGSEAWGGVVSCGADASRGVVLFAGAEGWNATTRHMKTPPPPLGLA